MMFLMLLFLIQTLTKSKEVNYEKNQIFYNCNIDSKHDQYDLIIPKFCNVNEPNLWHIELKKVYHYHSNNNTCTNSLEIVMVSKNFTMLLTTNLNKNENILLMDYIETDQENFPGCIPKNKKYHHFNYNIFVNVEKHFQWENDDISNKRLIEESFVESFSFHHKIELNRNAFLLGIESFLLFKSQTIKNILNKDLTT
uniref:Uncharacterized protein n=1 Tax=Strongyloides stercoralis TaxID=6248 RepID=A0A0K0ESU7_STRER